MLRVWGYQVSRFFPFDVGIAVDVVVDVGYCLGPWMSVVVLDVSYCLLYLHGTFILITVNSIVKFLQQNVILAILL